MNPIENQIKPGAIDVLLPLMDDESLRIQWNVGLLDLKHLEGDMGHSCRVYMRKLAREMLRRKKLRNEAVAGDASKE